MNEILDYPDNLVLHLERDRRSYKAFTTDKRGVFKIINGLWIGDSVIDTKYINERELKQLLVDSCINGYQIRTNLAFKEGLFGLARELASEFNESQSKSKCGDDSGDENVNLTIHEPDEEPVEKNC